jgi:hypothetical protein
LARALLLLCLVGLATRPARAQEDFLNLFASEFGQLRLRSDYRVTVFPDQPVAGQPAELGLLQQDFTLSVPLFQSPADEWSGAIRVRNQNFATGALLPDTGEAFPDELWNVRREPAWARDLSPRRTPIPRLVWEGERSVTMTVEPVESPTKSAAARWPAP